MKKNHSFTRRATKAEYPLIKNTAKLLANRFETQSNWIEVALFNTIVSGENLLDHFKETKGLGNEVLSDDLLHQCFIPSLISALSSLGAKKAKNLFGIDSTKFYEAHISGDDQNNLDDRHLERIEEQKINLLIKQSLAFQGVFNSVPPPVIDEDELEPQNVNKLIGLLSEFKKHLIEYQGYFLNESFLNKIPPFEPYPWFDNAFRTRATVSEIVFIKGLLAESGKNENRFFKNENERKKYEEKEQEKIRISVPISKGSPAYESYVLTKLNGIGKELIEKVKEPDLALRRKLFRARLFLVDELEKYFSDGSSREPFQGLVEYIKNEFSTSEYLAILGENPEYFGLGEKIKYSYVDSFIFWRLLDTALELPFAIENKIFSKFYKSAMPIYEFSGDVQGPHLLNFSFFDSYSLLNSHSKIENLYVALEALKVRRFALGKRLYNEVNNYFHSKNRSIASGAASSIGFKETVIGKFSSDFSSYSPVNKNLDEIQFTPTQADAMRALYAAFLDKPDGKIAKSQLIKAIYPTKKANEILDRILKAQETKPKVRNEYRYDWRLEKSVFKQANHPVWELDFIKISTKQGAEKSFYLDFGFETKKPPKS